MIAAGRRRAGGESRPSTLALARARARASVWAGAGGRGRMWARVRADINVTPLVDVVLVLLIIFMVVTPMLNKGVNVDLPITQHHDRRADDDRDIVVAVTHTGEIYVGSDRVALGGLGAAVAAQRGRRPDGRIFLKGDARLDFGPIRRVMEVLHRGGVEQIQLGTEEAKR